MTFTKLFSSITESTVWMEPDHVRLVWITMLAMADKRGRVFASIPGLANRARVPIEAADNAIKRFMEPDTYSRTMDYDGRRIVPIDGGWILLNYQKYREMRDAEDRKDQVREAVRRYREKKSNEITVSQGKPPKAQAEAEAEALPNLAPAAPAPSVKVMAEKKERARDPLFDALASISGANPLEVVGRPAAACGVALAQIKKATPTVTPEEIKRRAANYRTQFKDAPCTPSALSNQWAMCANAKGHKPSQATFEEAMANQKRLEQRGPVL